MGVIEDRIENLSQIVEGADNTFLDPMARKLASKLAGVIETMAEMDLSEQEEMVNLFNSTQKARAFLGMQVEFDTSEGNEACDKVKSLIKAEVVEGDKLTEAIDLVDRWEALKKKVKVRAPREKKDGEDPNAPDFAWGTSATCTECDKVVANEGARTGATRWAHLKHLVKNHHGEHDMALFGDREAWNKGKEEMMAGAAEVQIGQYVIRRVGE